MNYPSGSRRLALAGLLALSLLGRPASAATWVVDTSADAVDANLGDQDCLTAANTCSLRAAIQQANAKPGLDEIHLPAGTFSLSLAGAGENAAATGDLDITDDVTLVGAGERLTILDAAGLDRLFESHPTPAGLTLWLITLTVQGGAPGTNADGGCFLNPENGVLLLDRVTVRDCRGLRNGGAIFNGGRFEAIDSSLIGNGGPAFGTSAGGAVANIGAAAEVFLLLSEVRGNTATSGGGIYTSAEFTNPNSSEVRIEQSSLVGNRAGRGGAIDNNSLTHVYVQDSTLAGNEAGSGGGLANDGGGVYLIRNSTIAFNHASNIGGGIEEVHFDPQFIRIRNSVIAHNTAVTSGPDCHLRITSESNTLIGNTSGCELTGSGAGDLVNVDPKLGPLLKLSARVWAFLPLPGSPLIEGGANALCSERDQLGTLRPYDGNGDGQPFCDLGAIEAGPQLFASGFETGDLSEWSSTQP